MEAVARAGRARHVGLRRLRLHRRAHHQRGQHRSAVRRLAGADRARLGAVAARAARAAPGARRGARAGRRAAHPAARRLACAAAQLQINPGDAWVAVAVLCWTVYSLLLRAWPSAFGPLARLTLTAVAAASSCWCRSRCGRRWPGCPPSCRGVALALVLAAALMPGAGAYARLFVHAARRSARRASAWCCTSGRCTARCSAWLVLGERIEGFHVVGALLILPGIYLSTRP